VARAIAEWSSAAALSDLHERDLDAATQDILTIADLVPFLRNDRLLQGTRVYIGQQALEMTWEALQATGWEDGQLSDLEKALERASVLSDLLISA
jgi:hypothetical protein